MKEKLAEFAHEQWSGWMKYLFEKSSQNPDGTMTIPKWAVERWSRQMNTKYSDLSEVEKESDRIEADKMIEIFKGDNNGNILNVNSLTIKRIEEMALYFVLTMAQQSYTPDMYEAFVKAYNDLIDIRKLNLEKID